MTSFGYIRKSVVHDPARMLSPEMQEGAIRKLAASHGHDDVTVLSDLDISGTKGRASRPGWDELLRAVEDGTATAVYAYSLSRFARSVSQLDYFFKLCQQHGVPIRMAKDHIDTSNATGRLVSGILAQLAEFEADIASERVRDAFASKRAKDPSWDGPGNKPYGAMDGEDPMIVVAAFREAGSFDGAARLLNERGVQSRFSKSRKTRHFWSGSVVRGVVKAHAPDEVGPYVARGAKAGGRKFRFSNLIECSTCKAAGRQAYLTGSTDPRRGDVRYACSRARVIPHVRGWINESKLLPVVKAEADLAAVSIRRIQKGSAEDDAKSAALARKRELVIDAYTDGVIDKPERDRRLADVADQESSLSTVRWVKRITLPPDIENGDPARVNTHLRRLFSSAVVDMSQPATRGPSKWLPTIDFDWRDPSMRDESEELGVPSVG